MNTLETYIQQKQQEYIQMCKKNKVICPGWELDLIDSTIREVAGMVYKEIRKEINTNQKGTFTDDGGHDCWYIDDLVERLAALQDSSR